MDYQSSNNKFQVHEPQAINLSVDEHYAPVIM